MTGVNAATKAHYFLFHCSILKEAKARERTKSFPWESLITTCRTLCKENFIKGRDKCVARVYIDFVEITRR